MSTTLFEIKSSQVGSLLARFGLSHESKKGKCSVFKDNSFCKSLISFWSFLYYKLVEN